MVKHGNTESFARIAALVVKVGFNGCAVQESNWEVAWGGEPVGLEDEMQRPFYTCRQTKHAIVSFGKDLINGCGPQYCAMALKYVAMGKTYGFITLIDDIFGPRLTYADDKCHPLCTHRNMRLIMAQEIIQLVQMAFVATPTAWQEKQL